MKSIFNKTLLTLFILLNLIFFKESLFWFYKVLIGLHDLFNSVIFFLLIFFIYKNTSLKTEHFSFRYKLLPLTLCCISIVGYFLSERFIGINIISFIFLLLYVFSLLGFFLPNIKWKTFVIPFCLLIMVLPFGNILDVYIGFPLRMLSVNLVATFFQYIQIDYIPMDTLITIENNSSQIDFSCSGIKGLWAALIFYFTNTWLKKYLINFRWFIVGITLIALVLLLNTVRIIILVYFDLVLKLSDISAIIHVPLGIFGFVFSCLITYFLSEKVLKSKSIKPLTGYQKEPNYSFNRTFILIPLLQIILFFNIDKPPSVLLHEKENHFDINFITSWHINPVKLSDQESQFIKTQGGQLDKFSFSDKKIQGSGFVLKSKTWRSHHNPEYCITAGGREIIKSETLKVNNTNTIKNIHLDNGQQGYYWFQNKTYTTDDFGTRIWNEIFHRENQWFLICIIFNTNTHQQQKENFIKKVTSQIKQQL